MNNKWNLETTKKFIENYKKHQCLWNFTSNEYKTKQNRDAALLAIAKEMNITNFGVAEVKNKIKNLRSTYCQEKKKMEDSKKSRAGLSSVYRSNLKWLSEMEEVFASKLKPNTFENIQSRSSAHEAQMEQCPAPEQESTYTVAKDDITTTSRPRKRPRETVQAINTSTTLHDKINDDEEETSFDVFGKCVAMQLKNLSTENALSAQLKIQHILTEIGVIDFREKARTKTSRFSNQSVQPPTYVQSNFTETSDAYQSTDDNATNAETYSCKPEHSTDKTYSYFPEYGIATTH